MLHRIDNTTSSLPAEEVQELRRLLSGVAAGSQDDLAELYRRTRTAVYGLALSYLRNAHDAQDLTQDVFVHISAVERAGMREIVEGQKLSYELETDRKSGKMSACNLQAA